jgi:hypothetical protein
VAAVALEHSTRRLRRTWLWLTVILSAGAFGAAIAMAPAASAPPTAAFTWLLFLGSSVHVASTGWLLTLPEVRAQAGGRPLRYRWVPIGLVLGGAATAAVLSPATMTWFVLVYFAWQFFHFQKQNLGIAALAASSLGVAPLHRAERRALVTAGAAGIAALMAHPALLQLRVDPGIGVVFDIAGLIFVGAVATGFTALCRRPAPDRPPGFSVVYGGSLLFSLPIFVFGSPYAAVGGMTVAHGLQYLVLVGLIAGRGRGAARGLRVVALGNVALLGGILLSAASHLHNSAPAGRLLFGAYLGAVMAHFVIDAGLWRMRDHFPKMFMARYLPFLVPSGPDPARVPVADGSSADIG